MASSGAAYGMGREGLRAEEGVALMLVLLFVLLLTLLVVDYGYEVQVEASQMTNVNADFEAYVAAKSAVATAMGVLQADGVPPLNNTPTSGGQNPPPNAPPLPAYDARTEAWAQLSSMQKINDAEGRYIIEDEGGKLNLNALIGPNGQTNPVFEAVLRALFMQMEVEEDPVDAILDWLDPDEDVRPLGAETADYEGYETPYACKNGPMASLEELLLMRGITPELYLDLNRDPTATELTTDKRSIKYPEATARSLSDLLTVRGDPLNPKINVNTARRPLLEALFSDQPDPVGMAEIVCQAQISNPYVDMADFQARAGINSSSVPLLCVESNAFRIQGDGKCGDVMVRIEAYVLRLKQQSSLPQGGNKPPPLPGTVNQQKVQTFLVTDWQVFR